MAEYTREVRRVALELINAIFESLGLSRSYIRDKLEQGMQLIAVNYYPKNNSASDIDNCKVGLAPHSDYGFITILHQTSDGLQIIPNNSESWGSVGVLPGTLHVHLGDHLEAFSNGRYKSLVHRAVLGSQKRISIASVHGLSMDEKVETPMELVDEQHPKRYRESNFRDFLEYISAGCNGCGSSFIESLKLDGAA